MNLVLGIIFGIVLHTVLDVGTIASILGGMAFTALFTPLNDIL